MSNPEMRGGSKPSINKANKQAIGKWGLDNLFQTTIDMFSSLMVSQRSTPR